MNAGIRILLALVALVAGALAAIAGSPQPGLADDEISAIELGTWIRDRRAGLAIVDARPVDSAERDRIPGAKPSAAIDVATFVDTVVVYADDSVDERIVDAVRRESGGRRVLRLRGGMRAWNDDVLFPALRNDAPASQQQRFEARAPLSRYFGGTPRRLDPGAPTARTRSRRGC